MDPTDLGAATHQPLVFWADPESVLLITDMQGQKALLKWALGHVISQWKFGIGCFLALVTFTFGNFQ